MYFLDISGIGAFAGILDVYLNGEDATDGGSQKVPLYVLLIGTEASQIRLTSRWYWHRSGALVCRLASDPKCWRRNHRTFSDQRSVCRSWNFLDGKTHGNFI